MIDMTKTITREYKVGRSSFEIVRCEINRDLTAELGELQYPAGTIVNNHITNEVYQLTGVSPAVDAVLRKILEAPGGRGSPAVTVSPAATVPPAVSVLNVVAILMLLLGAAYFVARWRRRKSLQD